MVAYKTQSDCILGRATPFTVTVHQEQFKARQQDQMKQLWWCTLYNVNGKHSYKKTRQREKNARERQTKECIQPFLTVLSETSAITYKCKKKKEKKQPSRLSWRYALFLINMIFVVVLLLSSVIKWCSPILFKLQIPCSILLAGLVSQWLPNSAPH